MLARALAPKSAVAVDGTLKRLAGYTRLELQTPPDERFHRVYRGTHATRQDRVVLHLYDLSASDDPKAEPRARREFEALLRLQLHGWAPRILDSYQDAPGYEGEITFFTLADPAAPCIEERASDDEWDTTARLDFARSAVRALGELHQAGEDEEPMVHRNLTRRTLLVKHDNSPILTGFEHTRIPAHVSVGSADPSVNAWDDTVAPEIRAQGRGAAGSSIRRVFAVRLPDGVVPGAGRRTQRRDPGHAGRGNGERSRGADCIAGYRSGAVRIVGRVGPSTSSATGAILDGRSDRTLPR